MYNKTLDGSNYCICAIIVSKRAFILFLVCDFIVWLSGYLFYVVLCLLDGCPENFNFENNIPSLSLSYLTSLVSLNEYLKI